MDCKLLFEEIDDFFKTLTKFKLICVQKLIVQLLQFKIILATILHVSKKKNTVKQVLPTLLVMKNKRISFAESTFHHPQ